MGEITKLLLVTLMELHIIDTKVASLVVVIVKIVGDAGLRIS